MTPKPPLPPNDQPAPPPGIFKQYGPLTWEVTGFKINLPVARLEESFAKDIARHKRVFKSKERVVNLGSNSRVWKVTSEFYNGAEDKRSPGYYPDDVNAATASFDVQEVGTLTLPTRGPVVAVAWSYERVEDNTAKDYAVVSFVWIECDPDDETASQWQAPQASSVAKQYAVDYGDAMADVGIDGDPVGEIGDFCDSMSELANAPSDFVSSVQSRTNQTLNSIERTQQAFTGAASEGATDLAALLTNPAASRAGWLARRLGDTVGSARANHTSPQVIFKTYSVQVSLMQVAVDVQQDFSRLLGLNTALPNILAIPAGTRVRVYAPGSERRY